jgi:hypothetical protein
MWTSYSTSSLLRRHSRSTPRPLHRWIRAELDGYLLHLYGVNREDAVHLLETFEIVKAKDMKEHGTFRTKDLVLAVYDAMAAAIAQEAEYRAPFGKEFTV